MASLAKCRRLILYMSQLLRFVCKSYQVDFIFHFSNCLLQKFLNIPQKKMYKTLSSTSYPTLITINMLAFFQFFFPPGIFYSKYQMHHQLTPRYFNVYLKNDIFLHITMPLPQKRALQFLWSNIKSIFKFFNEICLHMICSN